MTVKDLIPNSFYYCYTNNNSHSEYFKYVWHDDYFIYCDKYSIMWFNNELSYHKRDDERYCGIAYLNKCKVFEKVDITVIIDYLPDSNPDKKAYYRKKKINYLLNV